MVTWRDYYAERQRRSDQIERGRRRRMMAEEARRSGVRVPSGRSRMRRFKAFALRLKATLRRERLRLQPLLSRPASHPEE